MTVNDCQKSGRLTVGAIAEANGQGQGRCAAAAAVHHQVGGKACNRGSCARGRVVGAHHVRAAVRGRRERPGEGAAGPESDWRADGDSSDLQGPAQVLPGSNGRSALSTRRSFMTTRRFGGAQDPLPAACHASIVAAMQRPPGSSLLRQHYSHGRPACPLRQSYEGWRWTAVVHQCLTAGACLHALHGGQGEGRAHIELHCPGARAAIGVGYSAGDCHSGSRVSRVGRQGLRDGGQRRADSDGSRA